MEKKFILTQSELADVVAEAVQKIREVEPLVKLPDLDSDFVTISEASTRLGVKGTKLSTDATRGKLPFFTQHGARVVSFAICEMRVKGFSQEMIWETWERIKEKNNID